MKVQALRELSAAEVSQKLRETSRELRDLRLKHASGNAAEKPVRIRSLRRDVARMLTVLREREAGT